MRSYLIMSQLFSLSTPQSPIDRHRCLNCDQIEIMAGAGLCFGSLGHFWYKFLDRRFPGKVNTLKKIACEAVLGPPLVLVAFMGVGSLEGKSWAHNWNSFKQNFLYLCLVSPAPVYASPDRRIDFFFDVRDDCFTMPTRLSQADWGE